MILKQGKANCIDDGAQLLGNVVLGSYNYIGKNVLIGGYKGSQEVKIIIGDCNYIHENTRILIGPEGFVLGDWNVLHNNMLVMGEKAQGEC